MALCLKIRAHHLLCLQGFQGYGYNQRFTDNMAAIIRRLDNDPGLQFEVIAANDVICAHCPNLSETGCRKEEYSSQKIRSLDLKVLEKLNYPPGRKEKARQIIRLTNYVFRTYTDIQPFCGNCDWKEKCLWFCKF